MSLTFTASAQNGNVGIGTNSPEESAKLDVESTSQGFLPPRMTQAQRDAMPVLPATTLEAGLIIYCNNCGTNGEMQVYNGTAWTNMVGGSVALGPPAIGDTYQGGIIFYLNGSGGGLIAAPTDQSNTDWGCSANSISGADGIAIGTGAQNTIDIEAGCASSGIAADVCANLVLSGYTDWFLPSKDELNLMYQNIGPGDALGLGNVGGFASGEYWSSTENTGGGAFRQNFVNGNQATNYGKGTSLYVRAVRAF